MVGTYVSLEVKKILPFGAILGEEEILLPRKYMPKTCQIKESLRVFVYTDSQDRPIATTLTPFGVLGDIVALEVVDVLDAGAYLDLGLAKDLFMPCKIPPKRGSKVVVQIQKDKEGRLIARSHFKLSPCKDKSKMRSNALALIYRQTPLGFECVVEGKYWGMLYSSELFGPLKIGEQKEVWIKNIRKDGRLDLKLQEDEVSKLLVLLSQHNNFLPLHFDSDPNEIYQVAQMSKKAFKRAVSKLGDKIEKSQEGITLLEKL